MSKWREFCILNMLFVRVIMSIYDAGYLRSRSNILCGSRPPCKNSALPLRRRKFWHGIIVVTGALSLGFAEVGADTYVEVVSLSAGFSSPDVLSMYCCVGSSVW